MKTIIRKYTEEDYFGLLNFIRAEGEEWADYLRPEYKERLVNSITYVAEIDSEVVGYSRSMKDGDFFIWVIDLLVEKSQRGKAIGRQLMECLFTAHPGLDVYVMSDVDEYYQKLGYAKEGSIFKVNSRNDRS